MRLPGSAQLLTLNDFYWRAESSLTVNEACHDVMLKKVSVSSECAIWLASRCQDGSYRCFKTEAHTFVTFKT